MTLLQHHTLALILTAVTTLLLGMFVFFAEPKRRLNQIFCCYSLTISGWGFTEAFLVNAPTFENAVFWTICSWPPVIFIGPTFIHTIYLLTDTEKQGRQNPILKSAYIISLIFLFLHLFTPLLTGPPEKIGYTNFHNSLKPLGTLMLVAFLVLVNFALWKLWENLRIATGRKKVQLKFLFWSSIIGYVGGTPDWLFTLGYHVPFLNPFGIYAVPCYSIAATYAVLQHRLFDVNLVIRKSLAYSILVTFLTIGYFGSIYGLERLFQITLKYQSPWISVISFGLMALFFQPLKIGIQRVVDWIIFRVPQEELAKRMERLELEARQTEKLRAVSTMAAGLCHELRNPLQAIQTYAEFLPEKYDQPDFREKCSAAMKTEITRINGLLKQLMDFAKPAPPTLQSLDPHGIIDSTADLLSNEILKKRLILRKEYLGTGSRIQADPNQFKQVVLNLLLNAIQASPKEGMITIATYTQKKWLVLEITDKGSGIDPKILPKLFEPFTTSKPDGNGLGLSIVHSVITEHHGRILARNSPSGGAVFTVMLPIHDLS